MKRGSDGKRYSQRSEPWSLRSEVRGFAQKGVPRSRGQPAGRLGQPFYGWCTGDSEFCRGRFSGPTGREIKKGR